MNARDRILATAGANMNESMGGTRLQGGAGGAFAPIAAPGVTSGADRYEGLNRVKGAFLIPLDRVVADPRQPRQEFDPESLDRLAASLQARGQLQPIRVRWDQALDRWVIIAGERRWRAATLAGLPHVAAVEAGAPLSDDEILEEQLIENCLRDDLKPVEQARAFRAVMERRGWNQKQLAEAIHVHPSAITRALGLLDLPAMVRQAVEEGSLAPSAAVALSRLSSESDQVAVAEQAVGSRLSRAEVEALVERRSPGPRKRTGRSKPFRAEYAFEAGSVAVTLKQPDPPLRAVAALLKAALAQVQAQIREGAGGRDAA